MKSSSRTTTTTRKIHANQLKQLRFYLDILTDGSEHTGQGATFLTIARGSTSTSTSAIAQQNDDRGIADKTILARYALSGLPTLTSRLAADQSFKLSPVRAVLCPLYDISTTAGIPSMLLSLSNHSLTGQLNIIGPQGIGNYSNEIVELILGRYKVHPTVLSCEIPSRHDNPNSADSADSATWQINDCWWKVYEDEFIFVHARIYYCDAETKFHPDELEEGKKKVQQAVYIVTIKGHGQPSRSFGVLPPSMNVHQSVNIFHPLPQDVMQSRTSQNEERVFDFILYNNPAMVIQPNKLLLKATDEIQKLTDYHLVTLPNHDNIDEDILLRASYQSKILNSQMSFAFPMSKGLKSKQTNCNDDSEIAVDKKMTEEKSYFVRYIKLSSCSSVSLECLRFMNRKKQSLTIFSRRDEIIGKVQKISFHHSFISSRGDELKRFYLNQDTSSSHEKEGHIDDNEIDLSDCESEEDDGKQTVDENEIALSDESKEDDVDSENELPHTKRQKRDDMDPDGEIYDIKVNKAVLVVLGTGCASPSALRGSSGYALMLPTTRYCENEKVYKDDLALTALIELGEGALLTLFRHFPGSNQTVTVQTNRSTEVLESLRFVFISHAHLDHYSELPTLILLLSKIRTHDKVCQCYDKRQRNHHNHQQPISLNAAADQCPRCKKCGKILPLLVVAPPKVLHFLDISTNCKHGITKTDNHETVRLYFGVTNRDFDFSPFAQQLREDLFQFEVRQQMTSSNKERRSQLSPQVTYCPFGFFKSIPVEHCPNAYALIIGLRSPGCESSDESFFTLCYSGDTRPSQNIVTACNQLLGVNRSISLLVHEVSFKEMLTYYTCTSKFHWLVHLLRFCAFATFRQPLMTMKGVK